MYSANLLPLFVSLRLMRPASTSAADEIGDGVALLVIAVAVPAQRGVGERLAGEVLKHGVLVAGLDALGGAISANLRGALRVTLEGGVVRGDLQRRQAERVRWPATTFWKPVPRSSQMR